MVRFAFKNKKIMNLLAKRGAYLRDAKFVKSKAVE
jgi:hypothetical protein